MGRTVNFLNVSEEKLNDIRGAFDRYLRGEYKKACELGIDDKISEEDFLKLAKYQVEAHLEHTKIMNTAMNNMADFANSNGIAVPGILLVKVQSFISAATAVEFVMAAQSVHMAEGFSTEELGDGFVAAMEASFGALKQLERSSEDPFEKLMKNIGNESCPPEKIIALFKEDLPSWPNDALLEIGARLTKLKAFGTLLKAIPGASNRIKRMDAIVQGINDTCNEEIARRRSSN